MPDRHIEPALESGVRATEVSEVITHLAFYAGWGNAMASLPGAKAAFERRGEARPPTTQPFGKEAFASRDTTLRWTGNAGFLINSRGRRRP